MGKEIMPKWQREVQSFLGIKTGLILEGNVYDEYPRFFFENGDFEFLDIDNLDQTLTSLVAQEEDQGYPTSLIFCDPIYGFYCYAPS